MVPCISVVIPCKNAADCLERALLSIIEQNYPALQIIVMDSASTDGTAAILKKYASVLYSCISEADKGQTDALIKGFARATGDVFCWLCADDYFEKGTFEVVAQAVKDYPHAVAWVGSAHRCTLLDRPNKILIPKLEGFPERGIWWKEVCIPQTSCFFSAAAYQEVGGIDPRFDLAMDLDLWLRLAKVGKFAALPQILSSICVHDNTRSGRNPARTMAEAITAYCVNGYKDAASRLFIHYATYEYWKQTFYRSAPVRLLRRWFEPQ